ncbi:unnamed protein product [Trichobilharzia regenti]|nr:unnamed protein product [Trichobilharzia regenti]
MISQYNVEREICDRAQDSAGVAIVSCFAFGPSLFKSGSSNPRPTLHPIASLFVGTKAGTVKVYSIFADKTSSTSDHPKLHLYYSRELVLKHRAPVLSLRLVDTKTNIPFSLSADSACGDIDRSFASGMSVTSHIDQNCEYSFVFTNVGGQAVVLNMPQLRRQDTLHLLDSHDVVAVSSVVFSQPGSTNVYTPGYIHGPALGLYQLAPGQKASPLGVSYRPIYRLSLSSNTNQNAKTVSAKSNRTGDIGVSRNDAVRNGVALPPTNDGIVYRYNVNY